jgi:hypothetical protein
VRGPSFGGTKRGGPGRWGRELVEVLPPDRPDATASAPPEPHGWSEEQRRRIKKSERDRAEKRTPAGSEARPRAGGRRGGSNRTAGGTINPLGDSGVSNIGREKGSGRAAGRGGRVVSPVRPKNPCEREFRARVGRDLSETARENPRTRGFGVGRVSEHPPGFCEVVLR